MPKPRPTPPRPSPSPPFPVEPTEPAARALMRSGTAARLAGISASTLRIWEHRYGVVAPPRSASGQRTYAMADVQRLRLIKRLTAEGHAIGSVANLGADELVLLSSSSPSEATAASTSRAQRVLVIGPAAARKLDDWLRPAPALVFEDLAHAEREATRCGAAEVLVVHLLSMQPSVAERVLALRGQLPAAKVIVVYSFGAERDADALRSAGVTVRREPIAGKELAMLIVASQPLPSSAAAIGQASPRRYSDAELAALAELPSKVPCECPRHLVEIVTLLAGFERYSGECSSGSPADAALHRHLHEVTGIARTMFEQALTRVVIDEGLVLRSSP